MIVFERLVKIKEKEIENESEKGKKKEKKKKEKNSDGEKRKRVLNIMKVKGATIEQKWVRRGRGGQRRGEKTSKNKQGEGGDGSDPLWDRFVLFFMCFFVCHQTRQPDPPSVGPPRPVAPQFLFFPLLGVFSWNCERGLKPKVRHHRNSTRTLS